MVFGNRLNVLVLNVRFICLIDRLNLCVMCGVVILMDCRLSFLSSVMMKYSVSVMVILGLMFFWFNVVVVVCMVFFFGCWVVVIGN